MKLKFLILSLLISASSLSSARTGLGAMVGNPIGVSYKHWLGQDQAVDGGLGMTILESKSRASLHSDYLFHSAGALIFNEDYPLDLHYGVGGRMKFGDDIQLGVRVPVGVTHQIEETSDMFAELAPIVDLLGKSGFDLHVLIGARYYFK